MGRAVTWVDDGSAGAGTPRCGGVERAPAVAAGCGTRVVSPRLVGRARELSRLAEAVRSPPAVVVVEGEAGIGKTRLVTELAGRPELAGRRFVRGWCRRIREPFPLGPVIEAIRPLGAALAGATLSPVAGALRPLLPELAGLLPSRPDPLDDRAAQRHRVFRALVEVLAALGPAVLVLEDLHWVDEQTVDFLSYLLGRPPDQLALVLTLRSEDPPPALLELAARPPAPAHRTQLALGPLDQPATGSLAAAILGTSRVSTELAGYLHRQTSGLPFAVEELVALLRERKTSGAGWTRDVQPPLDVPGGIRASVRERVSRLSRPGRSVTEAAAVLQTSVPVTVLAATCQVPAARVTAAVEEALGSGLLVEDGARIGFRHLLGAQAVYEAMSVVRRRLLHERAAAALGALRPAPLGALAHHLRQSGDQVAWVEVAERAAAQAVEWGHDDEGARLLAELLAHAPLPTDRQGRIAVTLGRVALDTLHPPWQVIGLLSRVLERDLPRLVLGELRFWLALLIGHTGADPGGGRQLLAEAIEDLDEEPRLKVWAAATMAVRSVAEIPPADPRGWLERTGELLPRIDDRVFETFVHGKLAAVLLTIGDPGWRAALDRVHQRSGKPPQLRREVHAYYMVATTACYAGHHQVADTAWELARTGVADCENRRLELLVQGTGVLLGYLRGGWRGLPEAAAQLIEELDEYPPARIDAELVSGNLALAQGDFAAADRRLSDAIGRAEQLADYLFLPFGVAGAARLALARGEVAAAAGQVDRLLAAVPAGRVWAPFARVLPVLAQALTAAGRLAEARAAVGRWSRELAGREAPLAPAAVRHAQGFLAAAGESWPGAARQFLAAARRYERLQCPYEAALAREQAADCLFRAGAVPAGVVPGGAVPAGVLPGGADPAGAGPALAAAMATYQRLGASWDLDRARRTARRLGVVAPNRHQGGRRGYGDQLSPREQEVAELAATGRTNKEIAGALFLSPSTVDKHLSAALRKLGLRSRTALAHQLRPAYDR